jgi:vacuolar-type H+-ATPase subunit E/Vma4
MALDLLLESLARDVEGDAREVLDAARAEAARIRAAAEARAGQRCAEALATREAALRASMDAERARARRDAHAGALRARARFLDRTFAAAAAELPRALDAPANTEALAMLVGETLEFFQGKPAVIRCRVGLADRVRQLVSSLGSVRVSPDDSVPEGVIVEAEDGSLMVNNTLIARMQRFQPMLSIELVARIGKEP